MRRLGGVSTAEFWRLTPRECDAICRDAIDDQLAFDRRNDWRNASLMCLIANIHRDPKGRAYKIEDFLPGGRPDLTDEEIEAKLSTVLGGLG